MNSIRSKGPFSWTARRLFGPLGLAAAVAFSTPGILSAKEPLTGDSVATQEGDLIIHPIHHATLVLDWKNVVIYVDPVGGASRFTNVPPPDLILITHEHGDHFSIPTLQTAVTKRTRLVAPVSVVQRLPAGLRNRSTILTNGASCTLSGVKIEAIPAYNTTPARLKYHPKGRDNGYVLTFSNKRVYISGDTEDIPEMRALKNMDVAFVCMNLPYTMTVKQAASAVREFRPKIVYPYHDRGSDVEQFKRLVGNDLGIEVRLRDWYRP